VHSH
jgi:hypothetical protein